MSDMRFEGEDIGAFGLVLRQWKGDLDIPLTMDEEVTLMVTARVTSVAHTVDRNGLLQRVHELRVNDIGVCLREGEALG